MKYFVIVRHAHRDTSDRDQDNGLSNRGVEQVADLMRNPVIKKIIEGQRDLAFFSSPKKRCIETIEPLATFTHSRLQILEDLDEQNSNESQKDFLRRIESFYEQIESSTHLVTMICSHGDWIPAFTAKLDIAGFSRGAQINLRKSEFIALEQKGSSKWKVVEA